MRIAYLTFERPGPESGVGKKIDFHVGCWRTVGQEVEHFVLNCPSAKSTRKGVNYLFSEGGGKPLVKAALNSGALRECLRAFNPDVVYMREMLWFPGLVGALSGFRLVQEINSDMRAELKLLRGWGGVIKRAIYSITKGALDGSTKGLVFVTGELARRSRFKGVRTAVISNGYVFGASPPPDHVSGVGRPGLIFVGSPGQAWHGVDKVLKLAEALREFDFHLVVPGFTASGPENVICHGQLIGVELNDLYKKVSVAIGSLALHRNGMDEACPLKCREYAANGLPMIAAYKDTDLSGASYYLELENTENNIEKAIPKIRDFVLECRGSRFPYDDAVKRLDAVEKERTRLEFFDEIVRENT